MGTSDRLLTDREVAMVIRRATELQEHSGLPTAGEGVSLEVLREIAVEIGLDPAYVDQAAMSVLNDSGPLSTRLLGAPIRERHGTSIPGSLSEQQLWELIERLRGALGHQGRLTNSLGSVEWGAGDLAVSITPRGEATEVQFIGDRASSVAPMVAIPLAAGLTLAGAIVDMLQPGNLEALAMLGAGAAGGLAVARGVWLGATRSFRRRLRLVQLEVRRFMEDTDRERV
jgi:hypothetical protein